MVGPGLQAPPGPPAELCAVMIEVKRSCTLPENVDLDNCFMVAGGTRQGKIAASKFKSALVARFPRIHWTDEKFQPLLTAYGCGYLSNIQYGGEVEAGGGTRQEVSWKDFASDVRGAELSGDSILIPSHHRRDLEVRPALPAHSHERTRSLWRHMAVRCWRVLQVRFNSSYGAKVENPDELHYHQKL